MKEFNPKEFVSGDLNEYSEQGRRDFAMTLMDIYVPSRVGDDHFKAICQGRAEEAAKTEDFFSTCGELAMFLLHQMGYVGPVLNRTLTEERDGVDRQYIYGANMSKIYSTGKRMSNFIRFKPGLHSPMPGDICFISNGPPKTEHVFVFKRSFEVEGKLTWESYDAGQTFGGKKWNQCSKIVEREVVGVKVGGRTCYGWIDIATLELTRPATLVASGA